MLDPVVASQADLGKKDLAKFHDLPSNPNADEDPIDYELVRVYPVRTKLARRQIGNAG